MRKRNVYLLLMMSMLLFTSCSSVSVNGDEEAVLIMKPIIFGSGGVDNKPVTQGLVWTAPTTDGIVFKVSPVQYKEFFDDIITEGNNTADIDVYLTLRIIKGKTPKLYENFGKDWYIINIMPIFRSLVRDSSSSHHVFELASDREVLKRIETGIKSALETHIKNIDIPIMIEDVKFGSAIPSPELLDESRRTAAQNQSKLTQNARANAELARKQAEINKAIADRAYMMQMGMTTQEYLTLRSLEIEDKKVEMAREKQNVTIVMGVQALPTYDIKK